MDQVGRWFKIEVYRWRTAASVIWCVILVPAILWAFFIICNLSLIHPYLWIKDSLRFPVSPSVWFYSMLVTVVQVAVTLYHSSFSCVKPDIPSNRLNLLWNVISPPRLLHSSLHGLSGGFLIWCILSVLGGKYAGLTKNCTDASNGVCLNEHHLFLVLLGVFTGSLYAVNFFWKGQNHVAFPVIQQVKFFTVKTNITSLLWRSCVTVLRQIKYFYAVYYILGMFPKYWITSSLGIKNSEDVAINSLLGMLDVSLLWHAVMCGTLIHFMWSLGNFLFHVYNTEPFEFPVETSYEDQSAHCLHNALACSTYPLVQYLAYLDLYLLSKNSPTRRKQVFSLSQPGGHPHNWKFIVNECLQILDSLTNCVIVYNNSAIGPIRQLSGDRTGIHTHKNKLFATYSESSFGSQSRNDVSTSLVDTNQSSLSQGLVDIRHRNKSHNEKYKDTNGSTDDSFQPRKNKGQFLGKLKKKPLLAYLLDDLPDVESRMLFADCQKQIWALLALSYLIVSSYTEDTYGVVQKSLPDILSAILSLQEVVERHFKLSPHISRKSCLLSQQDATLRYSLRSTIKTSTYRIVTTFEKHIRDVPLSSEHKRLLELYIENKE